MNVYRVMDGGNGDAQSPNAMFLSKEDAMGSGNERKNPFKTLIAQLATILDFVVNEKRRLEDVVRFLQSELGLPMPRDVDLVESFALQMEFIFSLARVSRNECDRICHVLQRVIADPNFVKVLDAPQTAAPVPEPKPLLTSVGTIAVPAMPAFKVSELFVKNTSDSARVKILHADIGAWFEDEVPANLGSQLRYADLTRDAYDRAIIKELGGEEKCVTSFSDVYALMEKQRDGKKGALLNNGNVNIFYIRNRLGAVRAVSVSWLGDGWNVSARGISRCYWNASRRVFSPGSGVGAGSSV